MNDEHGLVILPAPLCASHAQELEPEPVTWHAGYICEPTERAPGLELPQSLVSYTNANNSPLALVVFLSGPPFCANVNIAIQDYNFLKKNKKNLARRRLC